MKEVFGDIWEYPSDVICITTNGTIKNNGKAVMGRGVAYQATQRFPHIAEILGQVLKEYGNQVSTIRYCDPTIFSFPVKHHWREAADIHLIEKSARVLAGYAKINPKLVYVLPRPGCANGRLEWEDVKLIIEPILPDNVHVITNCILDTHRQV